MRIIHISKSCKENTCEVSGLINFLKNSLVTKSMDTEVRQPEL